MTNPINPFALEKIRSLQPIENPLKTADYDPYFPLALRQRAFFSAQLESLRTAQRMHDYLETRLSGEKITRGVYPSQNDFINDIQAYARKEGLEPLDPKLRGTLQDITSERRLKLIYQTQLSMAQNYARWKIDQDPEVLYGFPAQQLIRVASRVVPRDWYSRWERAGGRFYGGRMIALKSDPIWRTISRFGTPWPPFDFGSGMGLDDISRKETEGLGLIKPGEKPVPDEQGFNDDLQASIADLTPKFRESLKEIFKDQIDITGDVVRWNGLDRTAQQLVNGYTEGGGTFFEGLNKQARDENLTPENQAIADNLNAALDKLPKYQGRVLRGEKLPDGVTLETYIAPYVNALGKEITIKPFWSTSYKKPYPGQVQFQILSKSARKIELYSSRPEQAETLYKTGTKFKVHKIEYLSDGVKITLEEL